MDIQQRFDAVLDDGEMFDRIEVKKSQSPDLHACLLLNELFPKPMNFILSTFRHRTISFNVNKAEIESLTDNQILELVRCGVYYAPSAGILFKHI